MGNVKRLRRPPNFIVVVVLFLVIAAVLFYRSRQTPPAAPASTASTATAHHVGDPSLYPPAEAPGAVDPTVTQENIGSTICVSGYTKTVRPPVKYTSRLKRVRMAEYNLAGRASDYELDHMVPLELGGCPDCEANLWMEPWPDAREKDRVENYLHRQVCDGDVPLAQAQKMIMNDWYALLPAAEAHGR